MNKSKNYAFIRTTNGDFEFEYQEMEEDYTTIRFTKNEETHIFSKFNVINVFLKQSGENQE